MGLKSSSLQEPYTFCDFSSAEGTQNRLGYSSLSFSRALCILKPVLYLPFLKEEAELGAELYQLKSVPIGLGNTKHRKCSTR
jgi:hypothetical protein